MTTALVLGCNGQVGSYLCEHLLARGRTVCGTVRHSSNPRSLWRIESILDRMRLWEADLTDYNSLERALLDVQPQEVYNLADQDSVSYSHRVPLYSVQVTYGGVANLLEVLRRCSPSARLLQPISATVFRPEYVRGVAQPVHEETGLCPRSPYAVAKAAAWHLCQHYRERYGLYVTCVLPCNHDSPRRNSGYLLGELVRGAKLVSSGRSNYLTVGSLELLVDIGFAGEFAEAYAKLLGLGSPTDVVLGTGRGVRIGDLAAAALELAGIPRFLEGYSVRADPSFETGRLVQLVARTDKAAELIHWQPKYDALGVLAMIFDFAGRS